MHNDIEELHALLSKNQQAEALEGELNPVIVSEGVFSMDGDQAEVANLAKIAKQHPALVYIDEAHSIGVIGTKGQGSSRLADIDVVRATLGKSIATSGAFVACDNNLAEYLINFSRHYIYSTAISPALAWATKKSIEIIQDEHRRREKINELSKFLTEKLSHKIHLIESSSSIHAIVIGEENSALDVCQQLRNKGIWLTGILPLSVPFNSSRLRVSISARHEVNDINYLASCINEVIQ